MYGLGMSLLVTALTVALAAAKTSVSRVLKSGLRYVDKIAAAFITLTGAYLTWYWYGAITERESLGNVVSNVENWQTSVSQFIQRQGAPRLAMIFLAIVVYAVIMVIASRSIRRLRKK